MNRSSSTKRKLKKISKHAVWIIPGVLVPVMLYIFTASETDIRYVCDTKMVIEPLDKKDYPETDSTDLYFRVFETFKNLSFKGGHIERVEFTPLEIGINPEIKVTHVDKENFGWREQRKVEIRFLIHLTGEMNKTMQQRGKKMAVTMKAYDQTGKSLKVCDSEAAYVETFNLSIP
jgi:hypothetical protein